jgi:hypothetical protein
MPSSADANVLNVALAIAAVTAAAFGNTVNAPMFRVTGCGPPLRFTSV